MCNAWSMVSAHKKLTEWVNFGKPFLYFLIKPGVRKFFSSHMVNIFGFVSYAVICCNYSTLLLQCESSHRQYRSDGHSWVPIKHRDGQWARFHHETVDCQSLNENSTVWLVFHVNSGLNYDRKGICIISHNIIYIDSVDIQVLGNIPCYI